MTAHIITRYYGVYSEQGVNVQFDFNYSFLGYLKFGLIKGTTIGFLYSLASFYMEQSLLVKKMSTWQILVLQSFIYPLIITISLSTSCKIYDLLYDTDYVNSVFWWINDKWFWSNTLYAALFSFNMSFIKISIERFGKKKFFKILIGQYRIPKEERVILMFLDLKSSTTIAEKLGHFRYSLFIQECFSDLNSVIEKYSVEVYQYVGDEAILTWPYKKGRTNNNCIEMFFAFQKVIMKKRSEYKKKYGFIPEFKAGIHGGHLMTAEVGTIKKEIAYHGDVINTAARIQSKCNEFQQKMIISESLLKDLNLGASYIVAYLGQISLKGKNEEISLIGIKND
jgi:adenylate cyclase